MQLLHCRGILYTLPLPPPIVRWLKDSWRTFGLMPRRIAATFRDFVDDEDTTP